MLRRLAKLGTVVKSGDHRQMFGQTEATPFPVSSLLLGKHRARLCRETVLWQMRHNTGNDTNAFRCHARGPLICELRSQKLRVA